MISIKGIMPLVEVHVTLMSYQIGFRITICGCRVILAMPVSQRCNVGFSTAATWVDRKMKQGGQKNYEIFKHDGYGFHTIPVHPPT